MKDAPNQSSWRSRLLAVNFVCLGVATIWFFVALIIALTVGRQLMSTDLLFLGLCLAALWIERRTLIRRRKIDPQSPETNG